ncbi:MAG: DMT family transporter [Lachnospiraceae bacterium]|nr:DMT family transporter [Lachnospiraceae bacterium]
MKQRSQGIFFIIMAAFCFAAMNLFVRSAGDLPTMQKCLFRNLVALAFVSILLISSKEKFHFQKKSVPSLFIRSISGTIGLILNFYAIDHLNISDATMLNKLSPFFAIIFSYSILRETANKVEWIAVIIAFAGSLLVIKPSFGMESIPAIIGFLGGMCAGFAYTYVRKLGLQGERKEIIIFWFSGVSTLIILPFCITQYQPMSPLQIMWLTLAGIAATGGQFCITKAYTKAPAKEISVFDYTQVIFAALLGFFFLAQIPDLYSFIGYLIIIGVAVLKWFYNLKH